jgi:hypothetical protein
MDEKPRTEVLERSRKPDWEDPDMPLMDDDTDDSTLPESEFAVSPGEHLVESRKGTKGGGQNKKLDPVIGIPDPKFRLFKSDATNQHQRVKSFLNYWNGLPQWAKDNTLLYVYRDHPVLKYIERDPESKEQEFNYIDKISGSEPLQDEMDVLNRYGCGNYKLVFNAIEPKKPNRTLCTVYVVNLGNNDFKSNPPNDRRISDSKNVDLDHPNNKAYIAYLRGVGLLPSQIDAIRGEADMATVEVLKDQQRTTDKLLDAVLADKKEKPIQDPGFMERAVTGAMEVVKEGSKAAIKITQDANEYANRVREKVDSQTSLAPAENPLALALQIVELMKGGSSSGDAEVIALRAQLDKMRDDQITMFREELKSLRDKPVSHSDNPFNNIEAGLNAIKKMREMTEEISGAGEKTNPVEEAADAAGVPSWVTKIAMPLVGQIAQAAQGFFNMRAAQNMPPGQPPPPGYVPPGYVPPGYPASTQNPAMYPQPQPAPNTGPQLVQARHPLATLDPGQFTPELTQLLSAISIPLGAHLAEDINGTAFADWFMLGFGEETHAQIVGFGPEGVVSALYSFPPTLAAIQGFPVEKVQEFVAEFLNPQFEEVDDSTGESDKTPESEPPIST